MNLPPLWCAGQWNAVEYFRALCSRNILAKEHGFIIAEVSGLQGLSDLLAKSAVSPAVISVDDTSDGSWTVSPTRSRTMVKSLFLSMRHAPGDMEARSRCFSILNELFRQILTVISLESERLRLQGIQLDPDISASEIDRYFAPGAACLFVNLAVHLPVDLRYRPTEWLP